MTLKEIFKKYNAQPGFKFKKVRAFLVYEVLCIGIESVFVKNISDFGEESSFDLDMEGYVKYKEPKKTKKKKYGSESYNNSEKSKKTNLEKYGHENIAQTDLIKKKNLEKLFTKN